MPDGKSVITAVFSNLPNRYFDIYDLQTGQIKTYSLNRENFTVEDILEASKHSHSEGEWMPPIEINKLGTHALIDWKLYKLTSITPPEFEPTAIQGYKFTLDGRYIISGGEVRSEMNIYDLFKNRAIGSIQLGNTPAGQLAAYFGETSQGVYPSDKKRLLVVNKNWIQLIKFNMEMPPKNLVDWNRSVIFDSRKPQENIPDVYAISSYFKNGSLSVNPSFTLVAAGREFDTFGDDERAMRIQKNTPGWVRDLNTGKIKYLLTGQDWAISQTVFSPDGKYLATLGGFVDALSPSCSVVRQRAPKSPLGDGTVFLREASTGKIIKKYPNACAGLIFTPDSKKLLYSDLKSGLHIVDVP